MSRVLAVAGLALGLASSPANSAGSPEAVSGAPAKAQDAGAPRSTGETEALVALREDALAECRRLEPSLCYQRAFELLAADGGAPQAERAFALVLAACARGFRASCGAITHPKAISTTLPEYTEAARQKHAEGIVIVRCTVPLDGRPRDCRFVKSIPGMDEAVLAAMTSTRYEPATVLGRPVRSDLGLAFKAQTQMRAPASAVPRSVLLLALGLLGCGTASPRPVADTGRGTYDSPLGLEADGPLQHASPEMDEPGSLAGVRDAARAECQPIEPRLCHERAAALMASGAGPPETARAYTLYSEACRRGFAPSCAAVALTRPKAIEPAIPRYTKAAREHGVEGVVLVRCVLPIDGRPRDCSILKSLPSLDDAVLEALANSRYEPVLFLGRPVQVSYVFNFHFRLR